MALGRHMERQRPNRGLCDGQIYGVQRRDWDVLRRLGCREWCGRSCVEMARDLWREGARPDMGDFRVFLGCRSGVDQDHGSRRRNGDALQKPQELQFDIWIPTLTDMLTV